MSMISETSTIEKTEIKIEEPSKWRVIFYNDDVTPMGVVTSILEEVFNYDKEKAVALMLEIHHTGSATVGIYVKSIAETKQKQALEMSRKYGYTLKVTVEKE